MCADPVFLFPGQGSQYVGMGKGLYDGYPAVRKMFEEASDITGKDLKRLCFEGPASVLVQTENVQPAITLVNLACWRVLQFEGVAPAAAAGHSLGEYSALCAAGIFSVAETIRLVAARGAAMRQAADEHPGGMVAIFGLDLASVSRLCTDRGEGDAVAIANENSPSQIVITGESERVKEIAALSKQNGAKLTVPLKVSGPWHSQLMAGAKDRMREALGSATPGPARIPVIANVTAEEYPSDRQGIEKLLIDQIVSPVLWATSMRRLIDRGHRVFVEAGPGKVLCGLLREVSRDVKAFNVQDPESLVRFSAARAEVLS
jgi:[acyl-carrier-protein] S-malonyltransferase